MTYRTLLSAFAVLLMLAGCRTTKCPEQPFASIEPPAAPDYAQMSAWAAHPRIVDRADSVPDAQFQDRQDSSRADVFFIHPTTFFSKKAWNADLEDEKLNRQTESTAIKHQASIFNGVGRVYAPRYRQMVFGGFLAEEYKSAADTAFVLAYQDVRASFKYYLNQENEGRPFVIASHSQGAAHAIRLIREEIEPDPELLDRLIVAYIVGWPVRRDTFATLPVCESPDATGCFATWCTMEWDHEPENPGFFANAVCVNPITWRTDSLPSKLDQHAGVVMANYDKYFSQKLQAKVHGEYLWATRPKVPGTWVISGHNFHIADFNLFWGNVRENVGLRVERYFEGK